MGYWLPSFLQGLVSLGSRVSAILLCPWISIFHKPYLIMPCAVEAGSQGLMQSRIMACLFSRRNPETDIGSNDTSVCRMIFLISLRSRDLRLLVPKVLLNKCPTLAALLCQKSWLFPEKKACPVLLTHTIVLNPLVCLTSKKAFVYKLVPSIFSLGL